MTNKTVVTRLRTDKVRIAQRGDGKKSVRIFAYRGDKVRITQRGEGKKKIKLLAYRGDKIRIVRHGYRKQDSQSLSKKSSSDRSSGVIRTAQNTDTLQRDINSLGRRKDGLSGS